MPMNLRKLILCGLVGYLVFCIPSSFVLANDRTELEEKLSPDKAATNEELAKGAQNPVADLSFKFLIVPNMTIRGYSYRI